MYKINKQCCQNCETYYYIIILCTQPIHNINEYYTQETNL